MSISIALLREVAETQKIALAASDTGLPRLELWNLPAPGTHILVVCGIRRCGKSTLLHQYVLGQGGKFFYLNFDDVRLYNFSPEAYSLLDELILESGCPLLFFDEIQSAPRWELYLRQKLDEHYTVVVTGSNASLLSGELGTKLTGRHISKELFPFSYTEYCRFTGQNPAADSLDAYIRSGGFPEYLKTANDDILTQLQIDILHRDIAVRYKIRDIASLKRLFVYLVSNAAQLCSPSRLAQVAGVRSPTTVLDYLSYFESAYLIQTTPCFAWSAKKQALAPKKLYITDNGIIRTGSASYTRNRGTLFENMLFNALRVRTADICYYADKTSECDFVLDSHKHKPLLVQACVELSRDNEEREIRGLVNALVFFDMEEGVIITRDQRDTILEAGKRIAVIPAWDFIRKYEDELRG